MADVLLTEAQRTEYLDLLAQRIPPNIAAESIGFTGTQLRGLRSRDEAFNAECAEAIRAGSEMYRDRLLAQAQVRALGDSDRMLEVELATHVPGYEHLRRDKVQHTGRIEHALLLSPEQIDAMTPEDRRAFIELGKRYGAGAIIDGEFTEVDEPPALPPPTANGS